MKPRFWISRDSDNQSSDYDMWSKMPKRGHILNKGIFYSQTYIGVRRFSFCRNGFEILTGIKLKPGEVRSIYKTKFWFKEPRK